MALNGIGSLTNIYQKDLKKMNKATKNENSSDSKKSSETSGLLGNEKVQKKSASAEDNLSPQAKEYLKNLKDKYSNMDFMIGDENSEAARKHMRGNKKEFNVVIDPETLEQMAKDENVRNKYEDVLNSADSKFKELKDKLQEDVDKIKSLTITIDKDGIVKYLAELNNHKIENKTNDKDHVKSENENKIDKYKNDKTNQKAKGYVRVESDSIDELYEKIKQAISEKNVQTYLDEDLIGSSVDIKM